MTLQGLEEICRSPTAMRREHFLQVQHFSSLPFLNWSLTDMTAESFQNLELSFFVLTVKIMVVDHLLSVEYTVTGLNGGGKASTILQKIEFSIWII